MPQAAHQIPILHKYKAVKENQANKAAAVD